jgi:hypothetical protein
MKADRYLTQTLDLIVRKQLLVRGLTTHSTGARDSMAFMLLSCDDIAGCSPAPG